MTTDPAVDHDLGFRAPQLSSYNMVPIDPAVHFICWIHVCFVSNAHVTQRARPATAAVPAVSGCGQTRPPVAVIVTVSTPSVRVRRACLRASSVFGPSTQEVFTVSVSRCSSGGPVAGPGCTELLAENQLTPR